MQTAFISGATGFLGRHLVEQLVDGGWSVTALHRPAADIRHLQHPRIRLMVGDILEPDSLEQALDRPVNTVFHLAADTSQWKPCNARQTEVNVMGTRNMVRAAAEAGVRRFVHVSSIAVFGVHHGQITESTPSNAVTQGSNYMSSKYLAEMEVEQGIRNGLDAVFVNPPHIMGRYDRHNWSKLFQLIARDRLPGIPPGKGSFVHAPEVARTLIRAAERGRTGERYLLGGTDATFLDVVRGIGSLLGKETGDRTMPAWLLRLLGKVSDLGSRITGREPDLTPEKVQLVTETLTCSGEKAIRELGYAPVPLETMLKDTLEWLQAENLLA